jgi:hypothetical protein
MRAQRRVMLRPTDPIIAKPARRLVAVAIRVEQPRSTWTQWNGGMEGTLGEPSPPLTWTTLRCDAATMTARHPQLGLASSTKHRGWWFKTGGLRTTRTRVRAFTHIRRQTEPTTIVLFMMQNTVSTTHPEPLSQRHLPFFPKRRVIMPATPRHPSCSRMSSWIGLRSPIAAHKRNRMKRTKPFRLPRAKADFVSGI